MKPDLLAEVLKRIEADFEFKKTNNGWLQGGRCPSCDKRELFARADNPWVLRCGRLNKCGAEVYVKEEYPDLFNRWGERYQQTPENPHAAADAYLASARGFDLEKIRGLYTQENYFDPVKKIGSATVRFPIVGGYWERLIDEPGRFGNKKAHFNKGCQYAGTAWSPPGQMPEDEIWFVEGIFDSLALMHNGIWAATPLSCSNYPHLFLTAVREQCEANERPLPKLVFAYDDGKAGKDFMRRHVERARADKWEATAAYIRNERVKRDWNDLHLAGKLDAAAIDDARYRGALLLAKSASDKAGVMFARKAWAQFFFDFDNRLYWFEIDYKKLNEAKTAIAAMAGNESKTDQEIHDMAMEASRSVFEIANCNPVALYYQANPLTDESWYYVRIDFPHDGRSVKNTFTGAQLASASEFRKRLLGIAPGALYTGSPYHLDLWLKQQMFGIKTVETVDFIGYSKEHKAWIFDQVAVSGGRVIDLNEEDYFEVGKRSVKSLNKTLTLEINTDPQAYDEAWARLLWQSFKAKGIVCLAYWLGALFAEQIRAEQSTYPFIEIVGDPGAGKSTLIEFLWRLLGRIEHEGFDPKKASFAGRSRNFAQVAGMPVVLNESDRDSGDDKVKQKSFDWDELKTAYNGRSVRTIGVKNSGNDTYEPPFRAAIVISQNAPVSGSDAFMQRLVHVNFELQPHTDQSRVVFKSLEHYPVEKCSGFVLRACRAEEQIMRTLIERMPAHEKTLDAHPDIRHFRVVKNHAQLMALVDALAHVVTLREEVVEAVHAEIVRMAVERQQAINSDHPLVQEFWEVFDYLENKAGSDTAYMLNHSREPGRKIALNFNEFVARADACRQQVPDMREMKKLLKTSRARKFIAANQTINSGLTNKSVRCWIFEYDPAYTQADD